MRFGCVVVCLLLLLFFLSFFWHFLGDKSSLLKKFFSGEDPDKNTHPPTRPDFKPEKKRKEKKKEDFGAPKAKTHHHLKKLVDALENTHSYWYPAKRSTIMVVRVSCERRSNGLVGIFDARSLGRGSLSNVARGRKEEAHLEIFALKSSRFPEK